MKKVFGWKKKGSEQVEMNGELEVIDLDETADWPILDEAEGQSEVPGTEEESGTDHMEEGYPGEEADIENEYIQEDAVTEDMADEAELKEAADGENADEESSEYITMEDAEGEEDWEEEEIEYLSINEEEDMGEETEKHRGKIVDFFSRFQTMDKVVAGTGFIILLLAVVTGGAFLGKRVTRQQIEALAPVGEQLETVGIMGEDTLVAVADAYQAMIEAARIEEELLKKAEEEKRAREVKVVMKLTSVQKDLKIKFINGKNDKLVDNVPFEVKITNPSGKSSAYKDEDKDGIIYLTKLEPGTYSVAMVELKDMEDYSFSTAAETIKVKEAIEYKKVDVADEIKDASEVDVSKEDTAGKQETEGTLTDTVEWVESTRTEVSSESTYVQIQKSNIAEPTNKASLDLLTTYYTAAVIRAEEYTAMTEKTEGTLEGVITETPEESKPESSAVEPSEPESSVPESSAPEPSEPESSEPESSAPETSEPKPSEPGIGETTPSEPSTPDTGETKPSEPDTGEIAVTGVKLNQTSLMLEEGKTASLSATITPDNATDKTLTWSSSSDSVAKVDSKGTVTALKAGEAVITVKAGEQTAACKVKVTAKEAEVQIKLDKTSATLKAGESLTLKATVTPEGKTLSWSSSKPEVATVDKGKVMAKAAGETTITVTVEGKSAACKIKVTASYDPKTDTSTALKTRDGKQVYYEANGSYVEAKVADYYKHSTFYIKETTSTYRYTGWQNLDGKTYYFDKNGNKVTGEQVIQGARYTFNSDGSLHVGSGILGIDVSTWNGNINWTQVKNSGVSYVIIRTGFRGSTKGALVEDAKFRQNIQGATSAGLKVGVYFFTQAINEVEAVEEASMVLSQIKGYNITYPVFIDVESSGGRADGLDPGTRTRVINAFCQTIQNGGYRAGIYANKTWLNQKMNISALNGYKIWLAQYNTKVTYGGRYDMWQYSDKGRISGISTNVDMNLSYMTY